MTQACEQAGVLNERNILIAAHGTGTPLNDKVEAQALRQFFGPHIERNIVIATKSAHGHALGAGGAVELVTGVQALANGLAPPILGYLGPDPDCGLPLALGEPQRLHAETLVSNSFAFGGLNSVLIARRAR
jgi:nodulation protein E